ncbi:MAG: hypothetical protein DMG38_03750 [Acidobacteria bacterium]|nr:MAG: hypothetical protein DMG38_03750 [Acidobacteriota bacterium]
MAYLKGLTSNRVEGRESIIQISIPLKTRTIQNKGGLADGMFHVKHSCFAAFGCINCPPLEKSPAPGVVHAKSGAPGFLHVGVDSGCGLRVAWPRQRPSSLRKCARS